VLDHGTVIASYDRNYSILQTFEPFRQGDRALALISTHYTATAVTDLHTGQVVAAEEPATGGLCPGEQVSGLSLPHSNLQFHEQENHVSWRPFGRTR